MKQLRTNKSMRNFILSRKLYLKKVPMFPRLLMLLNRIIFSCDIPYTADIDFTVKFGHNGLGTVIHPKAIIGKNTLVMQQAILGGNMGKNRISKEEKITYPVIGNNVLIGAGAKILGPVIVGDNVQIGAGSVVLNDIPKNGVAVGVPAKVIKILTDSEVEESIAKW